MATSLHHLAALYSAQGRYAEAEPLYQRSLAIREKTLGRDHPSVAASLEGSGNALQEHRPAERGGGAGEPGGGHSGQIRPEGWSDKMQRAAYPPELE